MKKTPNIIIEGPDNTGKSTLADYLSEHLGLGVILSGGPPTGQDDLALRMKMQPLITNAIFDRHCAVSQYIYNPHRKDPLTLGAEFNAFFEKTHNDGHYMIYCRPNPNTETQHQLKPHDTPEHLESLAKNKDAIEKSYTDWAHAYADYGYIMGDDPRSVLEAIIKNTVHRPTFDIKRDILEFHRKFELNYTGFPRPLPVDISKFRKGFMKEELDEYIEASKKLDMEGMLDGLVDLIYVAAGTAHLHGFDLKEAWRRVHEANMKKVRATKEEQSKRNSTQDVIKPDGWVAPDLLDLVS